ncbi:MAG: response regulator [Gammaproteobacteria bacterium]|jgi:DNA-binding NtrC family response regulator|nr:MAG: response regulator [Gammaproteobacteria bacterium]
MTEKILLVDDEADFLEALSERMRARGMDVVTSASAREALETVEKGAFDAVVLDLMMPGMDGLEALRILKQKDPKLQVILLTGHATVEKGVEAIKRGAMDLLEKPADIDTLTQKIKEASAQRMLLVSQEAEEKIKDILASKGW